MVGQRINRPLCASGAISGWQWMASAACEMGEIRWPSMKIDCLSSIDGDYGDAWWFTEGLKTHGRHARIRWPAGWSN